MAHILVIGESGSGKSTSIRTLNPEETFLIKVIDKPLPFRGSSKLYKDKTKENDGNQFVTDDTLMLINIIKKVSETSRFKNLVIDDFQYILSNQYMERAMEKGFGKYNELADSFWQITVALERVRKDLNTIVLSHSEITGDGIKHMKTVGKSIDKYITPEGRFTNVFMTVLKDSGYFFQTQADECTIAKSPMGMFKDKYIPNDMQHVIDTINEYYEDEEKNDREETAHLGEPLKTKGKNNA